jgi:hypothetical protein
MKEGVTTTMKRRKGEGLAAPLMGGYPLSPIYMLDILLFSQHFGYRARGRCRLWRRVHDLVIVK